MLDFMRQFYDKRLWWVLGGILLTHLIAASVQESVWAWVPLIAIGVATLSISYHRLEWGLAVAFLEMFIGGHGHLIDVTVHGFSLSIREVLFVAVMAGWFALLVTRKLKPEFVAHRDLPFALLAVAVLIGAVKGFATNDAGTAFDDMNSYLTLGYFFPMISLRWDGERKRLLLQTFAVSAVWIALTTLVYLYAFTHLPGLASHELYTFVRDSRLAEITLLTSGHTVDFLGNSPWYFRVFQQSQAIVAAFELLLIAGTLLLWREAQEKLPKPLIAAHGLMIATILASLSRSFWIGCVAGFGVIMLFVLMSKPRFSVLLKRHVQLGAISVIAIVTLWLAVVIPVPPRPDLSESSFYKGRDENTREVAVSSRWNLLRPMMDEILADPIIGSGFGEEVTYISDDPRLRAIDPTGEVTTYRFEWGYHDLWLKMGFLGLLSFGWFFVTAMSVAFESVRRQDKRYWIVVGLAAGVVMFYAAHVFSPYLNHPIGLAFLLFILPFFPWEESQLSHDERAEEVTVSPLQFVKPPVGVAFKQ